MNLVEIVGNLGADAETRFTPSGQKVTNLRVATKSRRGNKEETIWWRVTIWGDRFDKMLPYLKKGSGVIIIGELSKPEIYTDKEGNPQVTLNLTAEIIRFSPFGRGERDEQGAGKTQTAENAYANYQQSASSHYGQPAAAGTPGYDRGKNASDSFEIESDELPF